jgi:hypothetical protein
MDLLRKTRKPVDQVLKDADVKKEAVGEVLVGGSTHIHKVQQLLKEYFGGKEPSGRLLSKRRLHLIHYTTSHVQPPPPSESLPMATHRPAFAFLGQRQRSTMAHLLSLPLALTLSAPLLPCTITSVSTVIPRQLSLWLPQHRQLMVPHVSRHFLVLRHQNLVRSLDGSYTGSQPLYRPFLGPLISFGRPVTGGLLGERYQSLTLSSYTSQPSRALVAEVTRVEVGKLRDTATFDSSLSNLSSIIFLALTGRT